MEWYMLILIGSVLFGLANVVRKKALLEEHTLQFLTTFYIVYSLMLLVLLPKVSFGWSARYWLIMIIKSAALALAAFAFAHLLRHYEISDVEPLRNLSPIVLLVLSLFILGEHPTAINLAGIAMIVVSAYVLESDIKKKKMRHNLSVFANPKVILLVVFYIMISICAMIDKVATRTIDIYSYLFFQTIFVAFIFLAVQCILYKGFADIKHALKKSWFAIIVSAFLFLVNNLLYLTAVAIPATLIVLIIPLKRVSTLVSTFIGGEFFHEKGLKVKVFACLVMLIGVYMVVI